METVRYEIARDLEVLHQADVIVAGGGPGGLGAAVMAARCGAKALLVERYGFLGGMAVSGEVHPFMANHVDDRPLDGPIYTEWIDRMRTYLAGEAKERHISKDAAMLAAEDLCLDAGVDLLFHHHLADVLVTDRAVDALVLFSKSGLTAAKGQVFIDCTGDADLAARAGCEIEEGGPSGHCQPMTLCFKLGGIDRPRVPDRDEINRRYDEARERGEIECTRENVLFFDWLEPDVVHFNTTRIIHRSGTSGSDLSAAELEGRKQMREFLRFFRTHVPGYENARIHSIAAHVGVRETRRVVGKTYLRREDFEEGRKFREAIARVRYPIDIHNPDGTGTEIVRLPPGEWYEIPYGCIVSKDMDNLLIGGRPISVDHAVHSSMRVMPPACTIGQAAGLAAALAASRGCRPGEVDGVEVRLELVEKGARL
jgi:hypothetical protein